ncbi:tRNA 5-methoxyuridine(34)/uridine 5-oxyacetic acid(34) synthase CmoB [Moraxella marmotae]|uniref:tRNA 5-methoxyuridine(34)/uridine 5-oxyacetic acid(34) synthase CmoB n=1 Tax=Moraxella marmotae TaxID=3344520 RepID=UPI0035F43A84
MNTIARTEQALYQTLFELAQHHPIAYEWLKRLPDWLAAIKNKERYAQAPYYASVIDKLPSIAPTAIDLNAACVTASIDFEHSEYRRSEALLKNLMPWRKGGFIIGNQPKIHIDTEWRSDLKWDRVLPHLSDLAGRRVLDVGGGSGYHGFRMVGQGASTVVVIDPSCLFYHQFMAIRHFLGAMTNRFGQSPIHFIPVGLEELPQDNQQAGLFHTVFCMGVLYHRASPFECLTQLKAQLTHGGELVLETLVVDGDEQTVLVPKDRYAMMNNVYFLPSVSALTLWLQKVGFVDIKCVDINITTSDEQRATAWMNYHSLSDFLDKDDPSRTLEGYPRPKRAVLIAKKP